jgi:NTP pyrophosphatase (non-canonical NTP hydrolase)
MSRLLCRQVVSAFSRMMLGQLYANDHKPGWRNDDPHQLMRRLDDEVMELRQAVNRAVERERIPDPKGRWSKLGPDGARVTFTMGRAIGIAAAQLEAIQGEAADVANFALMIADRCALLARAKGGE